MGAIERAANSAVQGTMPRADVQGFSLHAALRRGAHERQLLEQIFRCITRPALANERVPCNAAGPLALRLKTPWRDGTSHIVMSPLEFMQRPAARARRPRLHLIRFHGVLAPSSTNEARPRAMVVPDGPGPNCGGQLKIIASLVESAVIERILTHWDCRPGRLPGLRHAALCSTLRDCGPAPPGCGVWLHLARYIAVVAGESQGFAPARSRFQPGQRARVSFGFGRRP